MLYRLLPLFIYALTMHNMMHAAAADSDKPSDTKRVDKQEQPVQQNRPIGLILPGKMVHNGKQLHNLVGDETDDSTGGRRLTPEQAMKIVEAVKAYRERHFQS